MRSAHASRIAVTALFLLAACGPAPSPIANLPSADQVTILVRVGDNATRTFRTRDVGRIQSILELSRGERGWRAPGEESPTGEVRLLIEGPTGIVAAIGFGPDYLVAHADSITRIRSLSSAEYDALRALTIWWPPNAADYATVDTLTGPAAPVDFSADPDARRFRSQLSGASTADLAGHFAIVRWGCGTNCSSHMVLDLETGRPYSDTLLNFSCGTIEHERGSSLVIVHLGDRESKGCPTGPTRYLVWTTTGFVPLPTPWLIADTLSFEAQRPPTDSALVAQTTGIVGYWDALFVSKRYTRTAIARLEDGSLVRVQDPDDPPPDAASLYTIERDTLGRVVRASEMPVSQSGDGVVSLTHYFDERGRTIAVEQYVGQITGCLIPPAIEGGEETVVSSRETAIWVFGSDGATLGKTYRRTGDEGRDLTNAEGCNTLYHFYFEKYPHRSTWLAATALKEFAAP